MFADPREQGTRQFQVLLSVTTILRRYARGRKSTRFWIFHLA
jgi:hypothetical protein